MAEKMLRLFATQRLIKELSLSKEEIAKPADKALPAFDWYAHLFFFMRAKHLIFIHEDSLFTFVLSGLKKKDMICLQELFKTELARVMFNEGFGASGIGRLKSLAESVGFYKTQNRSVLGSLNEFVFYYKACREDPELSMEEINKRLNRMPMRLHGKYVMPLERFCEVLHLA